MLQRLRPAQDLRAIKIPQHRRQVAQGRGGKRRPVHHDVDQRVGARAEIAKDVVLIETAQTEYTYTGIARVGPGSQCQQVLISATAGRQSGKLL